MCVSVLCVVVVVVSIEAVEAAMPSPRVLSVVGGRVVWCASVSMSVCVSEVLEECRGEERSASDMESSRWNTLSRSEEARSNTILQDTDGKNIEHQNNLGMLTFISF